MTTHNDKPVITDPEALREHLVRRAMEAWDRSAFVGATGAERRVAFEGYLRESMSQAAQTIVTEIEVAREEAAQWHRKAQQTDAVRLRESLCEREAMQRERDDARTECDLVKALHAVVVGQRDAREHALREAEREIERLRAERDMLAAKLDAQIAGRS